jgi:hypothetical protein
MTTYQRRRRRALPSPWQAAAVVQCAVLFPVATFVVERVVHELTGLRVDAHGARASVRQARRRQIA